MDRIAVIFAELVLHMLGCVRQKIAVLVPRATLDGQLSAPKRHRSRLRSRCTIHDDAPGTLETACGETLKDLTPGRALSTHIPKAKQHLPLVSADTDCCQNRDVRRLPIGPRPDHAILAPIGADADRPGLGPDLGVEIPANALAGAVEIQWLVFCVLLAG